MTQSETLFSALIKLMLITTFFCALTQCSEDAVLPVNDHPPISDQLAYADSAGNISDSGCNGCTYVVPAGQTIIDGTLLGLKPGSVIGLNSAVRYGTLEFHNIVGTKQDPIIIKNFGGTVHIKASEEGYAVKTYKSKFFRITGGSVPETYGINIQGGVMGLTLEFLSTNFEVDHVEISQVRFAGLIAKTDPSCNDSTIRGNFTMYDVSLHDNYVHDTGGEGFYVGNSFYDGMDRKECGKRLPHEIRGLKIYNNTVTNSGWESIQVGCAIAGAEIHDNTIKNYGTANVRYQNNGIQVGSGTGGLVYNNFIKKGTGNGMIINGIGDNIIYNNIIVEAGANGIFCDERYTPGQGFKFINNTLVDPKMDGIRLYSELVPLNTVVNNIISNPGSYETYKAPRTSRDAFVFLASPDVKVEMSNNLFLTKADNVQFVDPANDNYRLKSGSRAVDIGKDISTYRISFDFYEGDRLKGLAYDIGASEF